MNSADGTAWQREEEPNNPTKQLPTVQRCLPASIVPKISQLDARWSAGAVTQLYRARWIRCAVPVCAKESRADRMRAKLLCFAEMHFHEFGVWPERIDVVAFADILMTPAYFQGWMGMGCICSRCFSVGWRLASELRKTQRRGLEARLRSYAPKRFGLSSGPRHPFRPGPRRSTPAVG